MLSATLSSLGLKYNWTIILSHIVYTYNNMIHSTTRKTPMQVMFGPDIHTIEGFIINYKFKEIYLIQIEIKI